jgi:hypothetical protein
MLYRNVLRFLRFQYTKVVAICQVAPQVPVNDLGVPLILYVQFVRFHQERAAYANEQQPRVSPTVFRHKGYRFFFFSREEERMHIHVSCAEGEAKFWMEPRVELDKNYDLSPQAVAELLTIIKERRDEIAKAWRKHFGR